MKVEIISVLVLVLLAPCIFAELQSEIASFDADGNIQNINFVTTKETDVSSLFGQPKNSYLMPEGTEVRKPSIIIKEGKEDYDIRTKKGGNTKIAGYLYSINSNSYFVVDSKGLVIRADLTVSLPENAESNYFLNGNNFKLKNKDRLVYDGLGVKVYAKTFSIGDRKIDAKGCDNILVEQNTVKNCNHFKIDNLEFSDNAEVQLTEGKYVLNKGSAKYENRLVKALKGSIDIVKDKSKIDNEKSYIYFGENEILMNAKKDEKFSVQFFENDKVLSTDKKDNLIFTLSDGMNINIQSKKAQGLFPEIKLSDAGNLELSNGGNSFNYKDGKIDFITPKKFTQDIFGKRYQSAGMDIRYGENALIRMNTADMFEIWANGEKIGGNSLGRQLSNEIKDNPQTIADLQKKYPDFPLKRFPRAGKDYDEISPYMAQIVDWWMKENPSYREGLAKNNGFIFDDGIITGFITGLPNTEGGQILLGEMTFRVLPNIYSIRPGIIGDPLRYISHEYVHLVSTGERGTIKNEELQVAHENSLEKMSKDQELIKEMQLLAVIAKENQKSYQSNDEIRQGYETWTHILLADKETIRIYDLSEALNFYDLNPQSSEMTVQLKHIKDLLRYKFGDIDQYSVSSINEKPTLFYEMMAIEEDVVKKILNSDNELAKTNYRIYLKDSILNGFTSRDKCAELIGKEECEKLLLQEFKRKPRGGLISKIRYKTNVSN